MGTPPPRPWSARIDALVSRMDQMNVRQEEDREHASALTERLGVVEKSLSKLQKEATALRASVGNVNRSHKELKGSVTSSLSQVDDQIRQLTDYIEENVRRLDGQLSSMTSAAISQLPRIPSSTPAIVVGQPSSAPLVAPDAAAGRALCNAIDPRTHLVCHNLRATCDSRRTGIHVDPGVITPMSALCACDRTKRKVPCKSLLMSCAQPLHADHRRRRIEELLRQGSVPFTLAMLQEFLKKAGLLPASGVGPKSIHPQHPGPSRGPRSDDDADDDAGSGILSL
ncbi:hypothetical protein DYB37_005591 [Aphanomyces astaci]|uniref:Uncharacterized protein n=1 Tax=Aphanomyces astaci TaxID=112090 RepID=A0A3R6XAP5_APHAT|nr:hypothetical protein DYB37_005591 [Aphanomyces astaci]